MKDRGKIKSIMIFSHGVRGRDQRLHFGRIKVVIC